MEFVLEPDNKGQPNEALLDDLRRVEKLVEPAALTKDRYNANGRWCAATMQNRFGSWNTALEKAGIRPSHRMRIGDDELLADLAAVSARLGRAITANDYSEHGKFTERTLSRAFGSWNDALRAAGLPVNFQPKPITEERCFEAIEKVWRRFGRQPRQAELLSGEVTISGEQISKKLGSWRRALELFVSFVRSPATEQDTEDKGTNEPQNPGRDAYHSIARSTRAIGLKLRFLVMRRDRFTCRACGQSPANCPGLALVLDHIVPWSKGGTTTFENLQTLCEPCNSGRGNLDFENSSDD